MLRADGGTPQGQAPGHDNNVAATRKVSAPQVFVTPEKHSRLGGPGRLTSATSLRPGAGTVPRYLELAQGHRQWHTGSVVPGSAPVVQKRIQPRVVGADA